MTEANTTLPRRWRAPAIASGVLLAAATITAGAYLWWSHHAETQWRQTFQPSAAPAAQPIRPEDDAGPLYQQAMAMLVPGVRAPSDIRYYGPISPPMPETWWNDADRAAAHYAPLVALLKEASTRPAATWPADYASRFHTGYPFAEANPLTSLLTDLAIRAQLRHKSLEALELIECQLLLADRLPRRSDIGELQCRLRMIRKSASAVSIICSDTGLATPEERAVARRVMLLLARPTRDDFHRLLGMAVDEALAPSHYSRSTVMRPYAQLQSLKTKVDASLMLTQVRVDPTLGLAVKNARLYTPARPVGNNWYTVLYSIDDAIGTDMSRHAAATAIAWRLYEADRGQPPAKLSDLVPSYLPYLPIDPLDTTGQPLRLITRKCSDGKVRPIVYSVGRDDIDATAAGKSAPDMSYNASEYMRIPGGGHDIQMDLFYWDVFQRPLHQPLPDPPQ